MSYLIITQGKSLFKRRSGCTVWQECGKRDTLDPATGKFALRNPCRRGYGRTGTSAAVTSLSQHTKQSRGTIPARPPALRRPNIVDAIPTPLPPPSESVGEPPGSDDAEQDEYPVLLPPLLLLPPENELPVPVWSQESVLSGSLWARRASG